MNYLDYIYINLYRIIERNIYVKDMKLYFVYV